MCTLTTVCTARSLGNFHFNSKGIRSCSRTTPALARRRRDDGTRFRKHLLPEALGYLPSAEYEKRSPISHVAPVVLLVELLECAIVYRCVMDRQLVSCPLADVQARARFRAPFVNR